MKQQYHSFVYFCLVLLFCETKAVIKCLECADPALQNNWIITKLPLRPQLFDATCRTGNPPNSAYVDCPSSCFTLILQTVNTNQQVSGPLLVRGCHSKLTKMATTNRVNGYCEQGIIKRPATASNYIDTKAQFSVCNTDQCNRFKSDFDLPANCNSNTNAVSCVSCTDCPSSQATCTDGHYCFSTDSSLGGMTGSAKGCSPINVFANDGPVCQTINDVIYLPDGTTSSWIATQCFCEGVAQPPCNTVPAQLPQYCKQVLNTVIASPLSAACGPHGTCKDTEGGAECVCSSSYKGTYCHIAPATTPCPTTNSAARLTLVIYLPLLFGLCSTGIS